VKEKPAKGFSCFVSREQIETDCRWPLERRLQWLLLGNLLRKSLPSRTIQIQEAFRQRKR